MIRTIAPTMEGRHRDGHHRYLRVSGCTLCQRPALTLLAVLEDLQKDQAYQQLTDGQLAADIGIATEILTLLEAEEQLRGRPVADQDQEA